MNSVEIWRSREEPNCFLTNRFNVYVFLGTIEDSTFNKMQINVGDAYTFNRIRKRVWQLRQLLKVQS